MCVCECETDGPHKLSSVWLRECVSEMSAQSVLSLMIRFVRWHTQVLTAMITAQLSDTLKTWKNMFFLMFS